MMYLFVIRLYQLFYRNYHRQLQLHHSLPNQSSIVYPHLLDHAVLSSDVLPIPIKTLLTTLFRVCRYFWIWFWLSYIYSCSICLSFGCYCYCCCTFSNDCNRTITHSCHTFVTR